jgi:hypothetical protein
MKLHVAYAVVLLVIGAPAVSPAQSLADVARKEAERREAIKEKTKTYTNDDLKPVAASATAPATAGDTKDSADAKDTKAADGKSGDKKDEPVKDQKYWSARMQALQTQLQRDQAFVDALQSQINGLTAEFSARDDPAQRSQIGQARQKAIDEQTRLQESIKNDKKAIDDLVDEARKANVPPGWLR